jgi:glycosyltransferase involved in cell wall biosynthesis
LAKLTIFAGIPAFNEEQTIAKVVARASQHVDKVLVVDDGSQDDTALIAEKLGAMVLRHGRNLGKGAAIRECFEWARQNGADVLVTLDSDGQHYPSQIPELVEALEKSGVDIVIGSRMTRPRNMPRHRWYGARLLDHATRVKVGDRIIDAQSGFRAYSRKAIEALVAAEYGMGVDSEIIMRADKAGMRIVEVPIEMSYNGEKTSTHNPLMHAFDVIFSLVKFVSIRHPLLFYGVFALLLLVNSLIFGFMTLDYYQKWGRVITNLALVSIASGILGFLALFTAVILFTLITVIRERH